MPYCAFSGENGFCKVPLDVLRPAVEIYGMPVLCIRKAFQHPDGAVYGAAFRAFPVAIAFLCLGMEGCQLGFAALWTQGGFSPPQLFQELHFFVFVLVNHGLPPLFFIIAPIGGLSTKGFAG